MKTFSDFEKSREIEAIKKFCIDQDIDFNLLEEWAFAYFSIARGTLEELHLETLIAIRHGIENNPEGAERAISNYLINRDGPPEASTQQEKPF